MEYLPIDDDEALSRPYRRCGGGTYTHPNLTGPAVYEHPCDATPTHRWRTPELPPGHWNYRCAQHVRWLSVADLTVEPLRG